VLLDTIFKLIFLKKIPGTMSYLDVFCFSGFGFVLLLVRNG